VLKEKRIVLWRNISAAIPKLGESMHKEQCGREKFQTGREAQANQISFKRRES